MCGSWPKVDARGRFSRNWWAKKKTETWPHWDRVPVWLVPCSSRFESESPHSIAIDSRTIGKIVCRLRECTSGWCRQTVGYHLILMKMKNAFSLSRIVFGWYNFWNSLIEIKLHIFLDKSTGRRNLKFYFRVLSIEARIIEARWNWMTHR